VLYMWVLLHCLLADRKGIWPVEILATSKDSLPEQVEEEM